MAKPLVAIVGRPNVGKSTFFNTMAGRRVSIVEDTPGVTRDRVYLDCEWQNYKFTLIDTGGIDPTSDDPLLQQMRRQAEIAIETCDVILFFVDGKTGMTADDESVADMLRKTRKPIMLVVNKIDSVKALNDVYEFYNLGLGDPIGISSVNLLNLGDLLEELCRHFPDPEAEEIEQEHPIQLAICGKPNVGKSSLTNKLLGQERVMVSDIAGTTRDAIDTRFTDNGEDFVIIDTAGIRRKRAVEQGTLERYSVVRAFSAIDRCDVAVLMIDANEGVTEQDTKIAGLAHEAGKASIIVVNKWDMLEKETNTMNEMTAKIRQDLSYMSYAPVLFISALTGQRVNKLYELINYVANQSAMRITTGMLNNILEDATARVQPPTDKGRRLKIYYMTQVGVKPPHFVFFCNDARLFHFSYQRYLENQIRAVFGLEGTPVRISIRQKGDKEE